VHTLVIQMGQFQSTNSTENKERQRNKERRHTYISTIEDEPCQDVKQLKIQI